MHRDDAQRTDSDGLSLDALATAVLWITPDLTIRTANAQARRLLRDFDVSRRRSAARLERAVGSSQSPLDASESRWLRRFLGEPSRSARRARARVGAHVLDVGIASLHDRRGEWIGWAIDAAPPAETHAPLADLDPMLASRFLPPIDGITEPPPALGAAWSHAGATGLESAVVEHLRRDLPSEEPEPAESEDERGRIRC